MTKAIKLLNRIKQTPPLALLALVFIALALLAVPVLSISALSFEAESGTKSGTATVISDSTASGGSALTFSTPVSGDPYANVPSNFDKSQWLATGEPIPPSSANEPSGNFRTGCGHSHFSYDDPIVYPGQQGAAHLHNFYGNSSANFASTYASLRQNGSGSCQGGPLNRSGYWVPALHNAQGKLVIPYTIVVYYKGSGTQAEIQSIRTNPNGLRMIAGYDMANPSAPSYTKSTWHCIDEVANTNSNAGPTIPSCPGGSGKLVGVDIMFPMCWDGLNLDSANHRSHMAYGTGGGGWVTQQSACPSSHPVHLPEFSLKVWYPSDGNTQNWYVSSDRMPGMTHPNGSTYHADWFGAWDNEIQETWTQECIREMRSCVFGQIGDGRRLQGSTNYNGPSVVDPPADPTP